MICKVFSRAYKTKYKTEKSFKQSAFSLVELTVTIALFCLLIGLVVANVRFLNRYLLRAQVDKLCNTFLYLQRSAITSGEDKILYFDIKDNSYSFEHNFEQKYFKLPKKIQFGVFAHAKGPPSSPSREIKSPITFKGNKVVFHKDGIIDSGTIYITDMRKKYMYAISCSVAQVSYIRKYMYKSKWTPLS